MYVFIMTFLQSMQESLQNRGLALCLTKKCSFDRDNLKPVIRRTGRPISLKRSYPELDTKFFEFK